MDTGDPEPEPEPEPDPDDLRSREGREKMERPDFDDLDLATIDEYWRERWRRGTPPTPSDD